jgi:hypothetical protein
VEAFSTGDTIFFSDGLHVGDEAMLRHLEDIRPGNIDTGLNAAKTHDTSIKPLPDQRGSIGDGRKLSSLWRKLILFYPEFIGAVLELAFSSSVAYRAVQRMIDQQ